MAHLKKLNFLTKDRQVSKLVTMSLKFAQFMHNLVLHAKAQ